MSLAHMSQARRPERPAADAYSRLVLHSQLSPGDALMLTAALRDLHIAYPGRFQTDVRTAAMALWNHNPYVTALRESDDTVRVIDVHYPLIHHSNRRPYHFLHGYVQSLEGLLDLHIPLTCFHGDVHFSEDELAAPSPILEYGHDGPYWIVVAGGKHDFTAKWWNPDFYQEVVDGLADRIQFVQCGEPGHWHPPLRGAINLVGRTTVRQFMRLMLHADGVLCPVTFAMHLAAAVPTLAGRPPRRPCVVVAGGREPPHWEAYPHHQFIHTVGMLSCCAEGGCWKSRCQPLSDGAPGDTSLCEQPVRVQDSLRIPRCMQMIKPSEVVARIEAYLRGDLWSTAPRTAMIPARPTHRLGADRDAAVLITFPPDTDDALAWTIVPRHLAHHHPSWKIDIVAPSDMEMVFQGLCRRCVTAPALVGGQGDYYRKIQIPADGSRSAIRGAPSTTQVACLTDVLMLSPVESLCNYQLPVSKKAQDRVRRYLNAIDVTTHSDGIHACCVVDIPDKATDHDTSVGDWLPEVTRTMLAAGMMPIRVGPTDSTPSGSAAGTHHLGQADSSFPMDDLEMLAALIGASRLFVGGAGRALHAAGATRTPAIGVWTDRHPVHSYHLADNVTHLVPAEHHRLVAGDVAVAYFRRRYRHVTYQRLDVDLPALVESHLTSTPYPSARQRRFMDQLPKLGFGPRYYHEHRLAGLDYLYYGRWQQRYGQWLASALGLTNEPLLDVGCACGALTHGMWEAGISACGVDVNEHMIGLGRRRWPAMAESLEICDASHLHSFANGQFAAVHVAGAAEECRPNSVPGLLRELRRVTRPGGNLLLAVRTLEDARGPRYGITRDRFVTCLRERNWWRQRLAEAGWQDRSDGWDARLRAHPGSCLQETGCQWLVAEAVDVAARHELEEPSMPLFPPDSWHA